jgi:hypothetical protein
MPFVSKDQEAWMWANKPEMAAEWEKHTPKGTKLPKKVKHKSHVEFVKIILAQQTQPTTTAPAGPQATPDATKTGNDPQYREFDLQAMLKMIPQIMGHVDSTDLKEVQQFMTQQMNISPEQAQQAANAYAAKIYKEERAKRQQQIVEDVGKKLGIDPSKIPNLAQSLRKHMTIIREAKLNRIVRTSKLKKLSQAQENIFEKISEVPLSQKLKNLYNFISHFPTVNEAVQAMDDFVDKFGSNFPPTGQSPVTASVGQKIGIVASILWIVTAIIWLGAAGTDQMNVNKLHPDQIESMRAIMMAFKSTGLAAIASALAHFFKKRELKK